MHLLWWALEICNCSAYVKIFNSSGISKRKTIARARVGIFIIIQGFFKNSTKTRCKKKLGPLNSLIGSSLLFLWLYQLFYSQFQNTLLFLTNWCFISHKLHNQLPQIHLEKCQHKNQTQPSDINLLMMDLVEIWHIFFGPIFMCWSSIRCLIFRLQIILSTFSLWFFLNTRFLDIGYLKLLHVVWIMIENLYIGIYTLWVIFEHFSTKL